MTRQQVRTFQRALGFLPVGDSVPPAAVSGFSPASAAGYVEGQLRLDDLAFTGGPPLRPVRRRQRRSRLSRAARRAGSAPASPCPPCSPRPRFVASYGRFSQAPDYQFLVDAAFDDTTRTGRFRRGNPNLGFEDATQYELSLRVRPTPITSLRLGVYVKRLDGLVASVPLGVNPDSTIFGNADAGSVKGAELLFERELRGGFGFRLAYTLQERQGHGDRCVPPEPPDLDRSGHRRHDPAGAGRVPARLRPPAHRHRDSPEPGAGRVRPQAARGAPAGGTRERRDPAAALRVCRSPGPTPPAIRWSACRTTPGCPPR